MIRTTTLALCLATLSGLAHADVIALSGPNGTQSHAYDINDAGYVVGFSGHFDTPRATMWDPTGQATYLGEPGGSEYSVAYAVNNNNQAVGYAEDTDTFLRTATLWEGGSVTDLGAVMNTIGMSTARDINDQGVVVGQAQINPGIFARGFVYDPIEGTQVAGTTFMGGSNLGVNNMNVTVGHSFFFGDPDKATMGTPDGRGGYETTVIGPDGFDFSIATSINNNGMIVGRTNYGLSEGWQAAIFTTDDGHSRAAPMLLGTLDDRNTSEANDVNDNGLVVGYAWDGAGTGVDSHAWAWRDGVMYDLNDMLGEESSFAFLVEATGVNNNGDIVGWGVLTDGSYSAFLIEGFVPAPGAMGLFAASGLLAARRRRRA